MPFAFIGLLLLGLELGNFIFGLLLFILYLLFYYYFAVGRLTISIVNGQLQFFWTKKIVFNFKDVEPINLHDINTIVIDGGQFLRKFSTPDTTIYINTTKINPQDNFKFIHFLQGLSKENNIRIINSWREWADKGYLKTAYRINIAVIIIAFIVVSIFIFLKGFSSGQLFIFLLFIPQLILYGKQMKLELKDETE